MAQTAPMPMCPMARTYSGMMQRPLCGLLMLIPGIIFVALGALILIWPSVLPWLEAAAFIVVGSVMLLKASFMRVIGVRAGRAGS